MSNPYNWPWQQGRGNFGQGNFGRGYPRYAVPNSQGNGSDWHHFHSQGVPFYGEQPGHGYFMGGGPASHPANSQWRGAFLGGQGYGFGHHMGRGNESYPVSSEWGRPFYGGQGHPFGFTGIERHSLPTYRQRGGPFYGNPQGRGFGHAWNEHQMYPVNNPRGGFSYGERGRGFGSHPPHNQRGGICNTERGHGRGNLTVGNGRESHAANNKSFDRKQGDEHEPKATNSERGKPFDSEKGPVVADCEGNKHQTTPTNSSKDRPVDGKKGLGRNEHESQPANVQRTDSPGGKQGRESNQRSRGQHHKGNRGRHSSRGITRDLEGSWRSGITAQPKSSSVPGSDVNKQKKAANEDVPGTISIPGNHVKKRETPTDQIEPRSTIRSIPRNRQNKKERATNEIAPKPTKIPGNHTNKKERPANQVEPKPTSIPRNHHSKKDSTVNQVEPESSSIPGNRVVKRGKFANEVEPRNDLHRPGNEVVMEQKFLDFPFIEHNDTVRLMPQFLVMFILRGLPGSGKTTIANAILQKYEDDAVVCSANHHHYNEKGDYVWNKDLLQKTHSRCRKSAEDHAASKKPVIIIDNTNVKQSEMEPYMNYAKQHGYVVVLVEPRTPWKRQPSELSVKSTHDVPLATIRRRLEQYEEILPVYFAWFVSPTHREVLQGMAEDVLVKCLDIDDFQQCIEEFTGHSSSEFTLDKALSYYSIDCEDLYHVTACFSPRGKSLAGSSYHKSTAVERALGGISQLSILGCVVTKDTLSARVSLTKEQQELWKNDHLHQDGLQQWKRGLRTGHRGYSLQGMTRSFQRLACTESGKSERPHHFTHASAHITLGTRKGVTPVQSKYDVQTVVNRELSSDVFEEHTLADDIGTVKKFSDTIWAVYFNEAHAVPAVFSGHYD